MEIKKNCWVEISATGLVSPNSRDSYNPDGSQDRWEDYNVLPGGHCALIAQISPGGEPFLVGRNYRFVADRSGLLLLGINDNDTYNNNGFFFVTVKFIN